MEVVQGARFVKSSSQLAPCRLCGSPPRPHDRSSSIVRCGNCGLTVKQTALGEGDAVERWNKLNALEGDAGGHETETPLEMPLCEAAGIGIKPDRPYRFVVRAGCAKCFAWNVWNAYLRGEGPMPLMPHPLFTSFCNPGVRVGSREDETGAGRHAALM